MVRNEQNKEKRHLQLAANVLCCFRVMAFLRAIRQHDGSVGTREAGWSSAGSAQGQEFTHTLSINTPLAYTHTHTHTDGCIPNLNIHDLNLPRVCFKKQTCRKSLRARTWKGEEEGGHYPTLFSSLIPTLHPMRINLSLNCQYYV